MRVALLNPPWDFAGSIYFGCREPHLPIELGACRALLERGRHEVLMLDGLVGKARSGDIRHCFADISLAREVLGYAPSRSFADSLGELAEWVRRQQATDRVEHARRELETRGLVA